MKFVAAKAILVDAISTVQRSVAQKGVMAILEGILITAKSELKFTTNDLEMGMEYTVESDVLEEGTIVVSSKIFGEIIRKMPDANITIALKDSDTISIDCENSHFEIKGLPSESFPLLPSVVPENTLSLAQGAIKDMIKRTSFAVGVDENRPVLTGSLLECKDNMLTMVAIDGFRMALRKAESKEKVPDFKMIIPGKTLNEIAKVLDIVDDKVNIYTAKNQAMFEVKHCKFTSRLIEGEYLNYNRFIPESYETVIKVNIGYILPSVERAALVTQEERKYPVIFDINGDKLVVYSNTGLGTVREEIEVEGNGTKMQIGFNPKYFIDALRGIDSQYAEICFTSDVGPCIIRPIATEDFIYMILPVRIK